METAQLTRSKSFIQKCLSFLSGLVFHYSKGGQDISLAQGLDSEWLVTGLARVGHQDRIWTSKAV